MLIYAQTLGQGQPLAALPIKQHQVAVCVLRYEVDGPRQPVVCQPDGPFSTIRRQALDCH